MQAKTDAQPSFTASGRRAQIITAAIEVIAEIGYARASFSRIAAHAGLSSTGMISYHFAGKEDLFTACVAEIEQVTGAYMQPRVDAAEGYVARVRTYVEANVALVGEHPVAVRALIDMVRNAGSRSPAVDGRLELFENHFRDGQAAGAFRAFDPRTVAVALIAGLDATVGSAAAAMPEPAELARLGAELADLYVRAIALDPEGSPE